MKVVNTIAEMREIRRKLKGPVGFVPTMGYLHEGHFELVRRANADCKSVVASIFVNPTQFGPKEDFATYPRDPDRDLYFLKEMKTDVVFMPDADEMYPPGCNTWVEVGGLTEQMEGAVRPGHFRGVATVVAKLFNIVEPDLAYFGQKDAQQLVVISKMASDLNTRARIIAVPTVREIDGLAMSSRNVYLDEEDREAAPVIFQALTRAQKLHKKGERDAGTLRREMTDLIQGEPRASIDYISIANPVTLEEIDNIDGKTLISLAVRFGNTRLIDALVLDK